MAGALRHRLQRVSRGLYGTRLGAHQQHRTSLVMARILIQHATVVTMDPGWGDLRDADVLIEGDRIVDSAPGLAVGDAERVDGRGMIVIPGFVNSHMHTWQTALRGIAADWTLP